MSLPKSNLWRDYNKENKRDYNKENKNSWWKLFNLGNLVRVHHRTTDSPNVTASNWALSQKIPM